MSYYRICPHCGAALDPGEPCDCQRAVELRRRCHDVLDQLTDQDLVEQAERFLAFVCQETDEKSRPGATNTETARAEQIATPVSASIIAENEEDCKR